MRPGRVVAAISVNRGRSSRIDRAVGPLPSTTSRLKSSSAGYRTSSTARGMRWISSTNSTSPSSRFVRIAARSQGRSSAGPLVGWKPAPISFATIWASVVLPEPGRPAEQEMVDRVAALARAFEEHLQLLLHPVLPHELVEGARAQRDVELAVLRAQRVGLDQALVESLGTSVPGITVIGPPSAGPRAGARRAPALGIDPGHDLRAPPADVSPSASNASRTSASGPVEITSPLPAQRRADPARRAARPSCRRPAPRSALSTSPATTARRSASGVRSRQERQRDLRPDAGHPGQQVEQLAFVG